VRDDLLVALTPEQAVVDLAYSPDGHETALVAEARRVGSRVIVDGLEALVRQGASSFERWTGVPAPIEVMRAAVRIWAESGLSSPQRAHPMARLSPLGRSCNARACGNRPCAGRVADRSLPDRPADGGRGADDGERDRHRRIRKACVGL